MARAPSAKGKSRLASDLSSECLHALKIALLENTLLALQVVSDAFVFFTPDSAALEIASFVDTARPCVPQGEGDLGARMLSAIRYLLQARNFDAAILVGTDIPWLTADRVRKAADVLEASGGVVLGPADDGGYYLIGMTRAHEALFEGIAWGTATVLKDTLRVAERSGIAANLLQSAYDVDTIDDVERLGRDLSAAPAGAYAPLRRWFALYANGRSIDGLG
jgi:uncharacterized protein